MQNISAVPEGINYSISRLDKGNVEAAAAFADASFPADAPLPGNSLRASLLPEAEYRKYFDARGVLEVQYAIATDASGKVIGVTGVYTDPSDEQEAAWVGWFAVDPTLRNSKIGKQLFTLAEAEARNRGKKFLRVYNSDYEKDADAFYEKMGMTRGPTIPPDEHRNYTSYVWEKSLQEPGMPAPIAGIGTELRSGVGGLVEGQ